MSEQYTYRLEWVFSAPVETLWRFWSEANLVLRWYGPNVETRIHKFDFKPGGVWLNEMSLGTGPIYERIDFTQVDANERIIWTQTATDADWAPVSKEALQGWPQYLVAEWLFEDSGEGETRVTLSWAPFEATEEESQRFSQAIGTLDRGWSAGMMAIEEMLPELT